MNRTKIEQKCKDLKLDITSLDFDRSSIPTPEELVVGGQWILVLDLGEDGESGCVGSAEEVLSQLDEMFETA